MKSVPCSRNLLLILVLVGFLGACSSPSSDIEVVETDSKQEIIEDIIHINNCGGAGDTEQTATRSFSTTVEGSITVKASYQVVEGSVSAKYGEARNTSKSIKLVAPPGTNMEFTLQWTEQTWFGRITGGGESGNYTARMPISVEQIDAKNIGCDNTASETLNWAISFEYRFPAGFWSVGTHEYTFESLCPNIDISGTHGGSTTQTFEVSNDTALLPGDVYLRLSGLREGPLESNVVDKFNPLQTTTAVWNLVEMTQTEAELASHDCKVTITWDGSAPESLKPGLPFQR